jgi:hypothetical protein
MSVLEVLGVVAVVFVPVAVGIEVIRWRRKVRPRVVLPTARADAPTGSPAVGALLCADGNVVDGRALAASVLDLAVRGHIEVAQIVGDHVSVTVRSRPEPTSDSEAIVLDELSRSSEPNRASLWEGASRGWARRYRRAIVHEARVAGLIDRPGASDPGSPIAMAMLIPWTPRIVATFVSAMLLVLLALGNPPLTVLAWIAGAAALVPGIAYLLWRLPWEPTPTGRSLQTDWLAHRVWLDEQSDWRDRPIAGVAVWGEHLTNAAATGLARRAILQAIPPSDRESMVRALDRELNAGRTGSTDAPEG